MYQRPRAQRDRDGGWPEALPQRIGDRRVATAEAGTAGYLGLLLGTAPWLLLSEQIRDDAVDGSHGDPQALARQVRAQAGADVGLAAVAYETDDAMRVEISVVIEGRQTRAAHSVFRGGDAGRRRAANAAAAELWRRLKD